MRKESGAEARRGLRADICLKGQASGDLSRMNFLQDLPSAAIC